MIETSSHDGWRLLTLARPERKNALSIELRDRVSDQLDAWADDPEVRAVAITGAGDVFSAGFDLSEFAAANDDPELHDRIWASSDRFHHRLLTFPLPLIAAVNGPALAGGFDLAVCCDVRLAHEAARFAHPEFEWGDVVYGPLEAIVGGATARDLALTGRSIDATEAHHVGLVSDVAVGDQFDALVDATMARTVRAPRASLMRTKAKAIRRAGIEMGPTLDL